MKIACRARAPGLAWRPAVCVTAVLGSPRPASTRRRKSASRAHVAGLRLLVHRRREGFGADLEISYEAIEDPFQSFGLATAGQLDVVSSTIEFAPIATAEGMPVKLVAYGNISYGTDKIVVGPASRAPRIVGKKVAVLEGGLAQLYMAIWRSRTASPTTRSSTST